MNLVSIEKKNQPECPSGVAAFTAAILASSESASVPSGSASSMNLAVFSSLSVSGVSPSGERLSYKLSWCAAMTLQLIFP